MAESRVTSITADVLATPISQARLTFVTAEILATASSNARVSAIALEALVVCASCPFSKLSAVSAGRWDGFCLSSFWAIPTCHK